MDMHESKQTNLQYQHYCYCLISRNNIISWNEAMLDELWVLLRMRTSLWRYCCCHSACFVVWRHPGQTETSYNQHDFCIALIF